MPDDLAKMLRSAALSSGQSHADIARATGIPQPTVTRFLNGADMKLSTAARLAAYFGLELREAGGKGKVAAAPARRKR
ncbi:MAG TPA: helix-turn-helix transcriptional regulator [Pirellulales bacterium]|nr:helix-turn-helix transcriptional regulator [Pirellulales bacterium]